MYKNTTKDNLCRLMNEQGINQSELHRATKVPQPTIQRILSGEIISPKIDQLVPLCLYFSVTIDEMVGFGDVVKNQSKKISESVLKNQDADLAELSAVLYSIPKEARKAKLDAIKLLISNTPKK